MTAMTATAAMTTASTTTTTPRFSNPSFHECLYDSFTLWAFGVVGNGINVFGLVGNLLTFFVLVRMSPKTSILVYLIALTLSDMIILFFSSVTIFSNRAFGYKKYNLNYVNDINRGYFFLFYLTEVFLYFNTWLTLAMCTDRWISVCLPLKAAELCKKSKALKVVFGLAIAISLFNIPKVFESKAIPDPTNITHCLVTTETPLLDNQLYHLLYKMFLDIFLRFLIPLLLMVVFTILTIKTLRSSAFGALEAQKRKKLTKMTNTITWMCVAVVIVYVLCQVPLIIVYSLEPVFPGNKVFEKIFTTAILLINVNSSVNFIIYCLISPNFRRVFFNTLYCKCLKYMRVPLEDDGTESALTRETSVRRSFSRSFSRTHSMESKKEKTSNGFEPEKIAMKRTDAIDEDDGEGEGDKFVVANRETSV